MAWLTVDEYANFKKITRQAVYKQISQDKLTIKKDEKDVTLVYVKGSQLSNQVEIVHQDFDDNQVEQPSVNNDLAEIRDFFINLIESLKKDNQIQLERLNQSKENEIKMVNDKYNSIIDVKDDQIIGLKEEIERLRKELEKSNTSFFKRLFG